MQYCPSPSDCRLQLAEFNKIGLGCLIRAGKMGSNKNWSMGDHGFQSIAAVEILAMRASRLVTTATAIDEP